MPSWEPKPKPPAPQRRRRRWLIICGAVLGVIVLLIALLPSIASMGWVRSIVVNKINQQLNGRVQIRDWSLGWTHGAIIRGITIQQNERQILELRELRTGLSVTDVVTGNYLNFGDVDVEGLDFVLIIYPDGSTNFEKLAKTTAPSEEPAVIPAISGNFNVDFRGTIERQQKDGPTQVVHIDRSVIRATVTDINQPIRHSLEINARTGTGEGGRMVVSGQVRLFDGGQFVLPRLAVNDTIELQSLDLRALGIALGPGDPINQVAGIASGRFAVKLQPGDDPTVNGTINVANLLVSGPALMGDRFTRDRLSIEIPIATYVLAENRVRLGNGQNLPMAIRLDQDQITLAADARIDALLNLARGAAPGSAGSVHLSTNIDLKPLADQLPNTLRLVKGIQVDSGRLTQTAAVTFTDNSGTARFDLSLSDLAGRDAQKKRIAIRPIQIGAGGEMVITKEATDWRNPALSFTSGFGQISGGGPSIAQLQAKGEVRLADLRQELAPFVDLEGVEMGGVAQFDLSTKGDLLRNDEPVQVTGGLALSKVVLRGLAGLPKEGIVQDELDWRIGAKVFRDAQGALQVVRDITLAGRIGPANSPTAIVEAGGELALAKPTSSAGASAEPAWTLPRWTITRLQADIGRLQRELAPVLPELAASGYSFPAGTLTLSGEGSFTGSTATLGNLNLTLAGLVVEQTDAQKTPHQRIDRLGVTLRSAGDVRLEPNRMTVRLTDLHLVEANQMFSLKKGGTDLIWLILPGEPGALPIFNGRLEFAADARPLLETILKAAGQPPLPPPKQAQPGDLLAAKVNGFIEVLRAENNRNLLLAEANVSELTVAPANGPIRNEKLTLMARASTDEKFTSVDAQRVALTSAFANLVANAQVTLPGREAGAPPVSVLDIVRGANVSIDMPELQKVFAVVLAFMPQAQPAASSPAAPAAAEQAPAAPSQPLTVGGGSFKGALSLSRTGNSIQLRTDEWVGRGIELRRGERRAAPLSFNLSLGGQLAVSTADASKPLLEQLQNIQLAQLAARLETPDVKDMAEVALAQPIKITRSAAGFDAAGSLRIAGRLPPAMRLAEVVADLPNESLEYAGAYDFLTEMRTDGPVVTLVSDGQVRNLTFGQGRDRVRESMARLAVDLILDQQRKDLTIRNLRAHMEGTGALAFSVTGAIRDYERKRTLDKVEMLLSYDAAALLKLAGPMLPADLRTLRASGVVKDTSFVFGGSYPAPAAIAPKAPTDPLTYLTARGQLALERIEYEGLVATDIVLPVLLRDGTLRFSDPQPRAQRPPPIRVNGGTLDLSPIEVHLTGDLRLSSAATNHRLLDKVTINRQFVDRFLSSMSPFFTGAQDARGVINVQINQMQNLALGEKLSDPRGSGRARITFSINNLAIKTPFVDGLAGSGGSQLLGGILGAAANAAKMDLKFNSDGTLSCAVREAVVDIDKGVVRSEMKLDIGQNTLSLSDTAIRLRDQSILSMNMGIPRGLLPYARDLPLPEVLNVPVTGTLTKFKFDIGRAIMDNTRSIIPGLGPRR
jgi:hypothetical protein